MEPFRPHPTVVHGRYDDHKKKMKFLEKKATKGFKYKFTSSTTNILLEDKDEWDKIKEILDENKTEYDSFTPRDEKCIRDEGSRDPSRYIRNRERTNRGLQYKHQKQI